MRLGLVRKYFKGTDNYMSLMEAINYSCWVNKVKLELVQLDTENQKDFTIEKFKTLDCLIIPGGFGVRGVE